MKLSKATRASMLELSIILGTIVAMFLIFVLVTGIFRNSSRADQATSNGTHPGGEESVLSSYEMVAVTYCCS